MKPRTDQQSVLEVVGAGSLRVRLCSLPCEGRRRSGRRGLLLRLVHEPRDVGLLSEPYRRGTSRLVLHDREFLLLAFAVWRRWDVERGVLEAEVTRYEILR